MKALLRKKPITSGAHAGGELRRCLGALDLTLLGIGAIIGTGIFVLTGIAAATMAGPAVVLSFVTAGIACAFAAFAYAELAASVGGCGSAYGYCYAAFGEFFAWCIGWVLLLEYSVAVAAVANGWSGYFNNVLAALGWALPENLSRAPALGGLVNLPALVVVLLLMGLLCAGVRQSAGFNLAMVFVKLETIAVFIAVAAFNVDPDNWSPFIPFGWFNAGAEGRPVGVLAGAAIVFFAYIGFDAVSTAAEEARDPRRDLPVGILASLLFCTLVYVLVAGLLTAIVPYSQLNVASPVAHALQLLGLDWASGLVAAGVIAGLSTVMLVLYYALTRVLFAMARDGLLPGFFAAVHPRTLTPLRAIVCCGIGIALVAGFVPLGDLAELVNIGTLSAFVMVCLGVLALRAFHPELPRPFRPRFGALPPLLGALSCGLLMAALPAATWQRFGVWLALGVLVYFSYSRRHSRLALQMVAPTKTPVAE